MNYIGSEYIVVKKKIEEPKKKRPLLDLFLKFDIPVYIILSIWVIWLYVH